MDFEIEPISRLEHITFYQNIDEGFIFTPINCCLYFLENWYEPNDVIGYAKILLLIKHIELCKKYGYVVDEFVLEFYLGAEHNITDSKELEEYFEHAKNNDSLDGKIEYCFTKELFDYFENLEGFICTHENAPEVLKELSEKELLRKYNFNLKDKNLSGPEIYASFRKYLIEESAIGHYDCGPLKKIHSIIYNKCN